MLVFYTDFLELKLKIILVSLSIFIEDELIFNKIQSL